MTDGMEHGDTSPDDDRFDPPSRRTYFAEERTLLAWWRTGIATAAVALAVGALLPKLGTVPKARFIALGAGYGILALVFVIGGTLREQRSRKALAAHGFVKLADRAVVAITLYLSVLIILTVVAIL